jgi:glycosyltransferase involved in cell wall biosynthesis
LLFGNGDAAGLSAALEQMLSGPSFAAELAAEGLRTVRAQYSLQRMADDYDRHYESALAGA